MTDSDIQIGGAVSERREAIRRLEFNEPLPLAASITEIANGSDAVGGEREAIGLVATIGSLPLAPATSKTAGRKVGVRRGTKAVVAANELLPPAAPIPEIADRKAGVEREATTAIATKAALPLAPIINALTEHQRLRQFCITSQSMTDRRCESFMARSLGYRADMPVAERTKIWKQVSAFRREVEKAGGEGQWGGDNQPAHALFACVPIILLSANARSGFDTMRANTEKEMRSLAKKLPVYEWAKGIAGFGDLGLGIIVAETGDLAGYATKERVWKRLGVAVINGERQRKKAGDAALEHGYAPRRRAELWTIVDSFFRHQWTGEKDGVPAHAKGLYGEIYAHRKAHTAKRNDPDWTPKRRENDARRIMGKSLVEDLHRVWNGKEPRKRLLGAVVEFDQTY